MAGRAKLTGRYRAAIAAAKRKGVEWTLSQEEFNIFREYACVYCGGPLNKYGSGLDRKDSAVGYIPHNVVACCRDCNLMKSNKLTFDEMRVAMMAVVALRLSKTE